MCSFNFVRSLAGSPAAAYVNAALFLLLLGAGDKLLLNGLGNPGGGAGGEASKAASRPMTIIVAKQASNISPAVPDKVTHPQAFEADDITLGTRGRQSRVIGASLLGGDACNSLLSQAPTGSSMRRSLRRFPKTWLTGI